MWWALNTTREGKSLPGQHSCVCCTWHIRGKQKQPTSKHMTRGEHILLLKYFSLGDLVHLFYSPVIKRLSKIKNANSVKLCGMNSQSTASVIILLFLWPLAQDEILVQVKIYWPFMLRDGSRIIKKKRGGDLMPIHYFKVYSSCSIETMLWIYSKKKY